jgi:hypothetical protein
MFKDCTQCIGCWGKPEGERPLEDRGTGRVVLKLTFKKWLGGIDWMDVAQDRSM